MARVKKITVKVDKEKVVCNYCRSIPDLMNGMFKDMSKPMLLEFDVLLRPATISTKSRGNITLPELAILTFDKKMNLLRRMDNIKNGWKIPMMFEEKYILEIPTNLKKNYEKVLNIKRLEFSFV